MSLTFFTTRVSERFIRSRIGTRDRTLTLSKNKSLLLQFDQSNNDFKHLATIINQETGIKIPNINVYSKMSYDAKKEIIDFFDNNTIFSSTKLDIINVIIEKGNIISDTLKYYLSIDNILELKHKFSDISVDDKYHMLAERFLDMVTSVMAKSSYTVNILRESKLQLSFVIPKELFNTLHIDDQEWEIVKSVVRYYTGYDQIDSKDIEYNNKEFFFHTPIFFDKFKTEVDYEGIITEKEIKENNIFTDDKPVKLDVLKVLYNKELEKMKLRDKLSHIINYINKCLINKENVFYDYEENTVSVFVPFYEFPEIIDSFVSEFIKETYMELGNYHEIEILSGKPKGTIFIFKL